MISMLALTVSANAQDTGGLFPELQKREQKPQPTQQFNPNAPIPDLFDNELPSQAQINENARLEQLKGSTTPSDGLSQQIQNDASSAKKRKIPKGQEDFIVITPERVQIITPSVNRFQFCMAGLTLQNNTKHNIKALKITADYSPVQMPLTFGATPAGETYTGRFYLAGSACQQLLTVPKITVDVCQADGMSVEECKSAVKYITDLRLTSESNI